MKIIIPMAGQGKRMRPHTLTVPKPLIPIAGKSIVQRLVEDIAAVCTEKVEEVAFITGRFGEETEENLKRIAGSIGAVGKIYYQHEALGIAHALLCARGSLNGKLVVAFADTLFRADFRIDDSQQGVIWVQKTDKPENFGVVTVNEHNTITGFVEKPQVFVSDLAIIGVYYFRDGDHLTGELQYLIDNNIKDKGEYQLTSALENMKNKGVQFVPGAVSEWLDCGNKDATVLTNQRILEITRSQPLISENHVSENSVIIQPCYIGENVRLVNSVIGPHVSVGNNSVIEDSVIRNSIIQTNTRVSCVNIHNSMLGNFVELKHHRTELSVGDYTVQRLRD